MAQKPQCSKKYFQTDHLKSNLRKSAIRGGGIIMFYRVINHFIQMVGTMFLARILKPDDFGLVIMVTSITGFFLIFKDAGLGDATIQEAEIDHRKISTLFWINVAISILIVALVTAFSPLIARFYGDPRLKSIAIISSASFVFAGLSIQHEALLKRNMLFFKIAYIEIIATLLSFSVAVILSMYGWGYWALVARPILYALSIAVGVWIVCQWRPGLPTYGSGIRSMLTFGMNSTGFFLVNYFTKSLDKTLIGWRYGAKEVGYYQKAFFLFLLPVYQLTLSLRSVAVVTLSKLRSEPEKFRKYYIKALSTISFIGMPMSAFMVVESRNIVLLLLGPQWGKTAEIFSILGIAAGIRIIYSTQGWLHVSLGRADRWLRWGIMSSLLTVIAISIALPYGSSVVAIAYTLSLYILTGFALSYAGKPIGLKLNTIISAIWKYFMASVSTGLLHWYLCLSFEFASNLFVKLLISFLLFVSLYLALIVALFQNTKPITQFISLLGEMLPTRLWPFRARTT